MSPTVLLKPEDLDQRVDEYIFSTPVPYGTKRVLNIANSKIQQIFGCSKDELLVSLKRLKTSGKMFECYIGRGGISIIIYGDNGSPPQKIGYDVFVSHATKDKIPYVNDLYKELKKLEVKIFYDQVELSWGDNWKRRILEATKRSEFAIIVISKNFFDREWTERELKAFLSRQNKSKQKIILPILYDVTQEEFLAHYPQLKEIQYITTDKYTKKDIAILFAKEYIKRIKE